MASVLHRTTKKFIPSVNTPDFSVADWIINPDVSNVEGWEQKYWIILGDIVSLMDQAARDIVDAVEIDQSKEDQATNLDEVIRAVVLALNDGSFIPGNNYTNQQLKTIIKDKL